MFMSSLFHGAGGPCTMKFDPNCRFSSSPIQMYSAVWTAGLFASACASKVLKSTPSIAGAASVPPNCVLIAMIEFTQR
jgi:hypothetical protein